MSQQLRATIVSSHPLNHSIWQYIIKPEHFLPYNAGQYLQIHSDSGANFYSLAAAPNETLGYELHIRDTTQPRFIPGQQIILSLPYGSCEISQLQPQKPILFLAAGTGFAPIRAMIDQLIAQHDPRQFELYWGVTTAEDLYDQETLNRWQQTLPHFVYSPHISQANQISLISKVLTQHQHDLQDWQIVMAGPFELMYAMRDALVHAGIQQTSIFSDAFEFE